jgi:hypothetical protein
MPALEEAWQLVTGHPVPQPVRDTVGVDIRERHIGSIATRTGDGADVTVNVAALVRRLLLFEHCTLESDLLKEIPRLIRVFGLKGVEALLESDGFSIICDAASMGSVGQIGWLKTSLSRGGPLPLGSYRIASVSLLDSGDERDKYIHEALQNIDTMTDIADKKRQKLKRKLGPHLSIYPRSVLADAQGGMSRLVQEDRLPIQRALSTAYREATGDDLPGQIDVHAEPLDNEGDFRTHTDLAPRTGVSEDQSHKIVERAVLGVAGVELRLQIMRALDSLSGFRSNEVDVFGERLSFLGAQLDPDAQERRFTRVASIADVPNLDRLAPGQEISMKRLLKLRESEECKQFRTWLREADTQTDEEISAAFGSLRERLAEVTHSRTGGVVRFLLGGGIGAIPVAGLIAGPVEAIADKFIVEKLIGRPGPVSFLGRSYRTIFLDPPEEA